MTLEIANRLVEYRKKAGLSQEELADKLGISRQAVSKWERVEASPDTDNLIALANLYGVSLDELINGKKETKEEQETNNETSKEEKDDSTIRTDDKGIHLNDGSGDSIDIDDSGIHLKKGTGKSIHVDKDYVKNEIRIKRDEHIAVNILYSIFAPLCLIAFILVGFLCTFKTVDGGELPGWAISWLCFIAMPIIPSFVDSILSQKICKFCFPSVAMIVFFILGFIFGLWHPGWVAFLTIPVFYMSFGPVDNLLERRKVIKNPNVIDQDCSGK